MLDDIAETAFIIFTITALLVVALLLGLLGIQLTAFMLATLG